MGRAIRKKRLPRVPRPKLYRYFGIHNPSLRSLKICSEEDAKAWLASVKSVAPALRDGLELVNVTVRKLT